MREARKEDFDEGTDKVGLKVSLKAQHELVIQVSRGIGKKMVRTFPHASH